MDTKKIGIFAILGGLLAYFATRPKTASAAALPTSPEVYSMVTNATRGERNNNPGNIRRTADTWQGMAADQSRDASFVVFRTPEHGIRALTILLRNYAKQGADTPREIINKYAPPNENNTAAYIAAVAQSVGVRADDPLNMNDDATALKVVRAIIRHENGRVVYPDSVLRAGIELA